MNRQRQVNITHLHITHVTDTSHLWHGSQKDKSYLFLLLRPSYILLVLKQQNNHLPKYSELQCEYHINKTQSLAVITRPWSSFL